MIEMLIVLAIIGILVGIVALDVRPLSNEALNAAHEYAGTVRQARSRAMVTTSAYRLVLAASDRIVVETRVTCDGADAWVEEPRLNLDLRRGTNVVDGRDVGDEIVCFDSRGIGTADPTLTFRDARLRESVVDVLVGGAVRVQ